jgi:peptide/nickel transport system substrate-binding protein
MVKLLLRLEKALYNLRDTLWHYPESAWEGNDSFAYRFGRVYSLAVPYSHIVLGMVLSLTVVAFAYVTTRVAASSDDAVFIEGVVAGVDVNGNIQSVTKINPLITSAIQLEKDLNELIYEPLIKYEQDGTVTPVLADQINNLQEGAEYEFTLRSGVKWHDDRPFGVDDVLKTLEVIKGLDDQNPVFSSNSSVKAVKQMAWERSGQDSFIICTTSADLQAQIPADLVGRPCTGIPSGSARPIIANFLELISFKIMPAHLIGELNTLNIQTPEPLINRLPVGTGRFKFENADLDVINLIRFNDYYAERPQVGHLQFRLYPDARTALTALENSEVHALAMTSSEYIPEIERYNYITINRSPVLTTQYWSLYFNLRKDPSGKAIGSAVLQDISVRQAVSAAINRDRILEVLYGLGEEAEGPIPSDSYFYNGDAAWYRYNPDLARQILEDLGWKRDPGTGFRTKDNQLLSFKLSYVDTVDRSKVVEAMRQDLAAVGIEVVPDPRTLDSLTREVVTPKFFDTLLFGMNTFIDPDRYELFHSSQFNNLNLSSYAGSEEASKIEGRTTVRLPRVDKLLEEGRSYNPVTDRARRKEDYDWMQRLIAGDAPVAFLYHPQFVYFTNNRVHSVSLRKASAVERRFSDISEWRVQ